MTEPITSLQNSRVKLVIGLQSRARTRRKEHKIVLEGTRLISDATQQSIHPLFAFYDPAQADYDLIAALQELRIDLTPASDTVMQAMSDTQSPQGIIAVYPIPKPELPQNPQRVLILDAIRDPGNMGTIIRLAAGSGVEVVILAPECVDPYNPKVLRSGMGAHFRIPVIEAQWHEIAAYCEPLAIYATTGAGAIAYYDIDYTQPHAIIMGNEAHGIGRKAEDISADTIRIPLENDIESLNAAMAASVVLFEAHRQRIMA